MITEQVAPRRQVSGDMRESCFGNFGSRLLDLRRPGPEAAPRRAVHRDVRSPHAGEEVRERRLGEGRARFATPGRPRIGVVEAIALLDCLPAQALEDTKREEVFEQRRLWREFDPRTFFALMKPFGFTPISRRAPPEVVRRPWIGCGRVGAIFLLKIKLVYLTGMPQEVVLATLAAADLVIDQVLIGIYGVVAIEAMALGKPTLCYLREDLVQYYPDDLPIIHAHIAQLERVIAEIVDNRSSWEAIGQRSIAYAERHHGGMVIAQKLVDLYSEL